MSTTTSRSLTITVADTDVRVLIDNDGTVLVSNLAVGRVIQKDDGTWAMPSPSGAIGRGFDLRRAVTIMLTRIHTATV